MNQERADQLTSRLSEEISEAIEAIEEEFELETLKEVVPKFVIDLEKESGLFTVKVIV